MRKKTDFSRRDRWARGTDPLHRGAVKCPPAHSLSDLRQVSVGAVSLRLRQGVASPSVLPWLVAPRISPLLWRGNVSRSIKARSSTASAHEHFAARPTSSPKPVQKSNSEESFPRPSKRDLFLYEKSESCCLIDRARMQSYHRCCPASSPLSSYVSLSHRQLSRPAVTFSESPFIVPTSLLILCAQPLRSSAPFSPRGWKGGVRPPSLLSHLPRNVCRRFVCRGQS